MNPWSRYWEAPSGFEGRLNLCPTRWYINDADVFLYFSPYIIVALVLFIMFAKGPRFVWRADYNFQDDIDEMRS
jgi:hypothetical protein